MAKALTDLLDEQQMLLIDCEKELENSLNNGYRALRRIHDEKLYKADGYKEFKEYCEKRWGWSKSHAYRLIDYSKIVDRLREEGQEFIPSEGQLRPVLKLKRSSKDDADFVNRAAEAARIAIDTAPRKFDVPQVTSQHTEQAMAQKGIYGGYTKKSKTDPAVDELKDICRRIRNSDLFKVGDADKWIKRHGMDGFPEEFPDIADLFNDCAALLVR